MHPTAPALWNKQQHGKKDQEKPSAGYDQWQEEHTEALAVTAIQSCSPTVLLPCSPSQAEAGPDQAAGGTCFVFPSLGQTVCRHNIFGKYNSVELMSPDCVFEPS